MSRWFRILCSMIALAALAVVSLPASAQLNYQQSAPEKEAATADSPKVADSQPNEWEMTADQLYEKFGLVEDPGPDPDPEHVYVRYGKDYTIGSSRRVRRSSRISRKAGCSLITR